MFLITLFLFILFLVSSIGILHTYFFYPFWMIFFTKEKTQNDLLFHLNEPNDLPLVDILFAAYNEESVLEAKLNSMLKTNYPLNKLRIFVGSDASTDRTNEIIEHFSSQYPNVFLIKFPGRTGKSGIINALAEKSDAEIFIMTDANVIFFENTIFELVKHFRNSAIAQVAANIIKISENKTGIATQEMNYIQLENKIKYAESLRWKRVIGAEGGCYAIRKTNYAPVPKNFFMDDFYITMNVIENNKQVLFEPKAICNEDVPTNGQEEFKRKVRISIGNFQNLMRYKSLLFQPQVGFAFLSHKVLRWLTPFFILITFISAFLLSWTNNFFFFIFIGEFFILLSPMFIQFFPGKDGHKGPMRYAAHFINMNAALLKGFFIWAKGVRSNVWEPTKRNV